MVNKKYIVITNNIPDHFTDYKYHLEKVACSASTLHHILHLLWVIWVEQREIIMKYKPDGRLETPLDDYYGHSNYFLNTSLNSEVSYFNTHPIVVALLYDDAGMIGTIFCAFVPNIFCSLFAKNIWLML